jgi:hypothetical protein
MIGIQIELVDKDWYLNIQKSKESITKDINIILFYKYEGLTVKH